MAVSVSSLVSRAQTILQDATGVRWPAEELIDWLNDGQSEVVKLMPSAGATTESFTLDSTDSRQDIPSSGIQFLRVVRNINGRAIRAVDRDILDSQIPDWHESSGTAVLHYVHDPVDPKTFYIYPKCTGAVELIYAKSPTIVEGGDSISIADVYASTVLDYVLYRAYSKDAEATANRDMANTHYTRFVESLSLKSQADAGNLYQTGVRRAAPTGS